MASVRQDARNGRWRVAVYAGIDPATGKKRYLKESLPEDASERAIATLCRRLEDEAAFMKETGRALTLDGLVEWYLDEHCFGRVAPATSNTYWSKYFRHISPRRGDMPAEEVMPFMVLRDLNAAVRGDDGRDPVGARTANGVRALLHAAFKAAVSAGLVPCNPVDDVPPMAEPQGGKARAFEPGEVDRIVEWAEDHGGLVFDSAGDLCCPSREAWNDFVTKQAALLALATGVRVGEACALDFDDLQVNRDGAYMFVCGSVTEAGGLHVKQTKGNKNRSVALDGGTAEWLRGLKETVRLVTGQRARLLPRLDGKLMRPRIVSERFSAACSAMGLGPDRRFHELRHTHATMLLEQGASVKVVSERLGHASEAVTLGTYSHLLPGLDRAAADGLGRALHARKGESRG